jgi:hypothetical protein
MNKTNKKFPIFFVLFTVFYIALEISFRADLLNVVSTIKDVIEIQSIEVMGRFIASIGFVIFIFSNFTIHIKSLKKWNILLKAILYPFILYFAFNGFYTAQEKIVNYFAENLTIEDKKDATLLSLEKESLYFGKIKREGYPYNQENKFESNSKIFLSLYPFLNYEDKEKINNLNNQQEKLVANSVIGKGNKSEKIAEMIEKESEVLNYLYFGFKNMDKEKRRNIIPSVGVRHAYDFVLSNYNSSYYQAKMNYKSDEEIHQESAKRKYFVHKDIMNRNDFEDKLLKDFSKAVLSLNSGNKKNQYSNASNFEYIINNNFYAQGHERNILINDYQYKYSDMRAYILTQNKLTALLFSDLFSGLRFNENNCSANFLGEGSIVSINNRKIYVDMNSENINNLYYEIFNKKNIDGNNVINCKINYSSYVDTKKELHELFTVKNADFYIDNIDKNKINPNLVNNNYLFRKIAMYLFEFFVYENTNKYILEHLNYDLEKYGRLEKYLDYSSKKAFSSSMNAFVANEFSIKFLEKANELGFNFNFLRNYNNHNISYEDFYNIYEVKKEIKRVMPFFINAENKVMKVGKNEMIDSNNIKEFQKYFIEKQYNDYINILNNPNLMNYGEKYYDFGNAIAKSFIAPPLVLFISGIMIFLSIINLIFKMINHFYDGSKKALIKYIII